jgi:hypothetical protein
MDNSNSAPGDILALLLGEPPPPLPLVRVVLDHKAAALLGGQAGLPSGGGLGSPLVRCLNGSKGLSALAQ